MNQVLEEFAKQCGAGPKQRIVVVWDGAGWHTSPKLRVPEGIHFVQLPAYSPELQPAECVWPLVNEVIANQDFVDLNQLTETVADRCLQLSRDTSTVRGRTNFWWWPDDRP